MSETYSPSDSISDEEGEALLSFKLVVFCFDCFIRDVLDTDETILEAVDEEEVTAAEEKGSGEAKSRFQKTSLS